MEDLTQGQFDTTDRAAPRSSFDLPRVSLVIPTLNEERNIPLLLPRLPDWLHEVILVDGCSTDHTVKVAQSLMPKIKVVMERRRGKGAALRAGFLVLGFVSSQSGFPRMWGSSFVGRFDGACLSSALRSPGLFWCWIRPSWASCGHPCN